MPLRPTYSLRELCTCGHLGSEHLPGLHGLSSGHGNCKKCRCPRFTWKRFVDKLDEPTEPEPPTAA